MPNSMIYSIESVGVPSVILARGEINYVKEVGGRKLYSFDGVYYFHKDSTKYKMVPRITLIKKIRKPKKFNRIPNLVLKSMESTQPADVYVNISESARYNLYMSLCNIIGEFRDLGLRWANYDSRLFVESKSHTSGDGMQKFLEVMGHEPSGIPKMFKCTIVDHCELLNRTVVRIDHTSTVDYVERFEHLTALYRYLRAYISCSSLNPRRVPLYACTARYLLQNHTFPKVG